jgi:hypothetical protein
MKTVKLFADLKKKKNKTIFVILINKFKPYGN